MINALLTAFSRGMSAPGSHAHRPFLPKLLACLLSLCSLTSLTRAEDLVVLGPEVDGAAAAGMTGRYLTRLAHEALDRRTAQYAKLKTAEDVIAYQQRLREFFLTQLGPLPQRTELAAKITGQETRDGYRIEKVIFESQPRHYVTGVLYLPHQPGVKNAARVPAVLVPCGHSANGKGAEPYQRACILLAKNGIAAFCYDPIGQGERFQLLDPSGKPRLGGTGEHTLLGVGAILVGRSTATYRIWDGMRAIDYLASRDDIDPRRIGCSGNSGGGTLTSYLMALDERVACAAPSCYLTSFERLLDTLGPQDAEQNIFGQVAAGLNHADYVLLRAPRPTLMCVATQDFFDIGGAWNCFREAKRGYARLGHAERVDLIETDAKHGFSIELRVGMVRWMRRWLLETDDAISEPEFTVMTDAQLQCSPDGQVMRIAGARSVIDLNAELESTLAAGRKEIWSGAKADALAKVRQLAAIRPLSELPVPKVTQLEPIQRDGYRIEKLVLRPEGDLALPALAFVPKVPAAEAYLYLHGEGKQIDAGPGGPIEKLAAQGHLVLAVDLRGLGETARASSAKGGDTILGADSADYFRAYLLGKSYVGMRAEDVLTCARFLSEYNNPQSAPRQVHLISIGKTGPAALHAAALEPGLFRSLALRRMLSSWTLAVRDGDSRDQLIQTVHGALAVYDLPDLIASLPVKQVTVSEPLDAAGQLLK